VRQIAVANQTVHRKSKGGATALQERLKIAGLARRQRITALIYDIIGGKDTPSGEPSNSLDPTRTNAMALIGGPN
jgi:hypothetical protein